MLTYAKIGEYISAEPFRPFLMKLAGGQAFEIRHPEMVLVGRSSVRVYTNIAAAPDAPPRWQDLSMMLMESLEPLDVKLSERQN